MPTVNPTQVAQIVESWRRGATLPDGPESPAGPLFSGGQYAESEIAMARRPETCGTICTGSIDPNTGIVYQCC